MPDSSTEVHPLFARIAASSPLPAREVERFVKFGIVGTLGALIDFAILNLLVVGLGWPDLLANAVSFTCAVLSNFTWNRRWTYPETREQPLLPLLGQFAVVSTFGLLINTVVLYFAKMELEMHGVHEHVALNIAKALAIVVVLFWNFIVNRLWTFRHVQ